MQDKQSFRDRIKPWVCSECGQKNISANKSECPRCHEPRGGISAEAKQVTRIYEGEKAMQRGIEQMAAKGWRVFSQTSFQPSAGAGRIVALGIFAAVAKPPMKFTVIFERAE